MKRIFKHNLESLVKYLLMGMLLFAGLCSCKEQERFEIGYDDSTPPGAPVYYGKYDKLYGGARIYFRIPDDEDLLSIDATFVNEQGKTVWFTVSYYQDTINIYGFSDTLEHVVDLYAVDRAGNKSTVEKVTVQGLEPAYQRIARSMIARSGFSSFFLEWENELEQNVNVYAEFIYEKYGNTNTLNLIYTSKVMKERWFIRDLEPDSTNNTPITGKLRVRVEDYYGNITDYIDKGEITMLVDEKLPKSLWTLPEAGSYPLGGSEPMGYLSAGEGRASFVIDDIIDDGKNMNYGYTGHIGRTGLQNSPNAPWNIMIDLGDEYEISRLITHQRYTEGETTSIRGQYYRDRNVGTYKMYIWNDISETWDSIARHTIPYTEGLPDITYRQMGLAGDMVYMYPDDPRFTPPTRWFRYEAMYAFGWTNLSEWANVDCISEITLYGRKAKK
jgi:hypothetical protein